MKGASPRRRSFTSPTCATTCGPTRRAPAHLFVQRRAGIVLGLAASGVAGPRTRRVGRRREPVPPPYRLVDNEFTLLDRYRSGLHRPGQHRLSRPAAGRRGRAVPRLRADIQSSVSSSACITTRYKRWSSPKFISVRAYGTTRAQPGLSGYLQDRIRHVPQRADVDLSILNFQTARFTTGNDLPHMLFLPTYAATAWYHHRLDDDLQGDRDAAVRAAEGVRAGRIRSWRWLRGSASAEDRAAGSSSESSPDSPVCRRYLVERSDLRIDILRFTKELLRDQVAPWAGSTAASRAWTATQPRNVPRRRSGHSAIAGAYTATLNDYVRRELRFESDLPYEIISPSPRIGTTASTRTSTSTWPRPCKR